MRVRLSNAFGRSPLKIGGAYLGRSPDELTPQMTDVRVAKVTGQPLTTENVEGFVG